MNKERIVKAVIKADQIKDKCGWDLSSNENLVVCHSCMSALFYIKINYGVVAEDNDWLVMGNRSSRTFALREIGFNVYCAECGDFIEDYSKYFYPEDKLVFYDLDELYDDDRAELLVCLNQFNQKRDFTARYKNVLFDNLKKKLNEYEKKHPEKKKC